ncbi:UNVERIFIED_CONTAM: hypothetical protein FKN15_058191 [Acipenser sinensis]
MARGVCSAIAVGSGVCSGGEGPLCRNDSYATLRLQAVLVKAMPSKGCMEQQESLYEYRLISSKLNDSFASCHNARNSHQSPATEGEPHQSPEIEKDYPLLPPSPQGDYLLLQPPLLEGDDLLLSPPPPEGDYLLLQPPPPEGDNLLLPPSPPKDQLLPEHAKPALPRAAKPASPGAAKPAPSRAAKPAPLGPLSLPSLVRSARHHLGMLVRRCLRRLVCHRLEMPVRHCPGMPARHRPGMAARHRPGICFHKQQFRCGRFCGRGPGRRRELLAVLLPECPTLIAAIVLSAMPLQAACLEEAAFPLLECLRRADTLI